MDLQQIGAGHSAIKHVRDIQNNTAPNRFKLLVADGLWEANVVLDSGLRVDTVFVCWENIHSDEAHKRIGQLVERAGRAYQISEKTLARITERGGRSDGIVVLAEMPHWDPDFIPLEDNALVLVTDGMEIPGNLGTLLRTMDAVQADALVMTNRKTRMSHPKVLRASQGMSARVPHLDFEDTKDAIAWLKEHRFTVYLADTDESINYRQADYSGRTAIVVGSEKYGIRKDYYDAGFKRIGIPMLGYADSLNAAVSASVFLYEARAQKAKW
ncbi:MULTISPECIES: RNA methyltransferase [unclassified Nocardiopsis]|uniref:TrmH family RNA methyltransferase n=1 Tax=unclassified Nocardiopsis TaxID=2649073 RepID=UPI0013568F40|nr:MULTISPECIES: TrmH family RNA methyltransferase [unclassified Nocardiopsis]